MTMFGNLHNIHLLHAIKEDAFKRAKDYKDISLIVCILDFVETASKKKAEGLLQEIAGYPRDIPLFDITIKGMENILSGLGTEELVGVLTKDYWDNPVKDSFAFDKYMAILTILMIKEGFPLARAQQVLLRKLYLRNQAAWKEEEWIAFEDMS